MTGHKHRCPGEDCPICGAEIARRESERDSGRPEGTFDTELDAMADAAAARDFYDREAPR